MNIPVLRDERVIALLNALWREMDRASEAAERGEPTLTVAVDSQRQLMSEAWMVVSSLAAHIDHAAQPMEYRTTTGPITAREDGDGEGH